MTKKQEPSEKPAGPSPKPSNCPACGSSKVLRMIGGYPLSGPPLAEDERFYGGCIRTGKEPAWSCDACGHYWGLMSEAGKETEGDGT